jgi:hypothetical protein
MTVQGTTIPSKYAFPARARTMMRCFVLASLVLSLITANAAAQQKPFNPYADENADLMPITPDGKINWPTFYKSGATKAKFDWMFSTGSCRGTNPVLNAVIINNKVNVNQIEAEDYTGVVQTNTNGNLIVLDKNQVPTNIMIHPKGVSKIEVNGPYTLKQLRAGMLVRITAKINDDGTSDQAIPAMEVFSTKPEYPFAEIETGERTTFAARVVALRDKTLELRVDAGKLRKLKLPVDDSTAVTLSMDDLKLASPGDKLEVTGHLYSGPGISAQQAIFANKIVVTKPIVIDKKPAKRSTSDLGAAPGPAKR